MGAQIHPTGAARPRQRDVRLDLFRGLAMIIIFIAHMPENYWSNWIPARFGPSDATEMFVFCSGCAAAIAFGGTFNRLGWLMGTTRVLYRCWQLYWAHLCLFLVLAGVIAAVGIVFPDRDIVGLPYIQPFFDEPMVGLLAMLTLTYVPNLFDILPMYMVVLALMPIMVALVRIHVLAAAALSLSLYAAVWTAGLNLPGNPWTGGGWFFNPFAWQFLFFTGFAFVSGWIRAPRLADPWLVGASALYVTVMFALAHWPIVSSSDWLLAAHYSIWDPPGTVTDHPFKGAMHPARYIHILALAYLSLSLFHVAPAILEMGWVRPVVRIGQQALPTFMASMVLAFALGALMQVAGHTRWTEAAANITGILLLYAVARIAGYFKAHPWAKSTRAAPVSTPQPAAIGATHGASPTAQSTAAGSLA